MWPKNRAALPEPLRSEFVNRLSKQGHFEALHQSKTTPLPMNESFRSIPKIQIHFDKRT